MKTLILLQTAAPDYRKKVFQSIRENLGENFTLYSGSTSFEKSIKTDETINFLKPVKNHYFFIRKVLFQTGMWQDCLQCDVLILELNPRIISNWLLLIFRKTLLKKSVLILCGGGPATRACRRRAGRDLPFARPQRERGSRWG